MMKKNGRSFRCKAAFLTLVILFAAARAGAFASEGIDYPEIEADRKGSIFVTLAEESGKTPTDGVLMLIPVDKLESYHEPLDEDALKKWIEKFMRDTGSEQFEMLKAIGTEAKIDSHGSAGFYDLPLGTYLIMQTVPSSGYFAMSSFYVHIPMFADGAWIYDIDASPKTELLKPNSEPELPPEEPKPEIPSKEPDTEALINGGLPQTGQLNWPIPLLAGGGLLFVVIGLVLSLRKKDRHAS